jgi:hypothetical protein
VRNSKADQFPPVRVALHSKTIRGFVMSTIFADAWLIAMNERREALEDASVCVEKDRIVAVGTRQDLERRFPAAEIVDCKGRIVMPGMVNRHTHLFQTLMKGLDDDMVLKKWFTCMTGPSGVRLTPEDAHAAALHRCVESIRSGVTTLVDFMYVHTRPGMIKSVVEAFEQTGMRGFVCHGFTSLGEEYGVPRELIEEPKHAIGDACEQMRRYNKPGARVPSALWKTRLDIPRIRCSRKKFGACEYTESGTNPHRCWPATDAAYHPPKVKAITTTVQKRDARHRKKLDQATDSPVISSCAFLRNEGSVRVL